jgi:hypothetical protein
MAIIYNFFGQVPGTVVLQTNDNFDGSSHTATPVITPGMAVFPDQCLGGLFDFHTRPLTHQQDSIDIKEIAWEGVGACEVYRVSHGREILIHTFSANGEYFENIVLTPTEYLKFVSTGTAGHKTVAVTATLAMNPWNV